MGSGKTTLARLLEKRGAILVDADRIGHEIIERPQVRRALESAFGEDILHADGALNRRELGRRAFADEAGRACLNRIVHPSLAEELWKQVDRASGSHKKNIVVVDAALIFEWGELGRFDVIVVVHADEEGRFERVSQRHHLGGKEIRQRLSSQLPVAEKIARADFVVENNGTVRELEEKAAELWDRLVESSK
jgi:dephospho-CoA kinase